MQNLVDHLQAAEQEEHLANPMLMQELVKKLPCLIRMDWATIKNFQRKATVLTFYEFMGKQVNAASEVSFKLPGFQKAMSSEKLQRHREKLEFKLIQLKIFCLQNQRQKTLANHQNRVEYVIMVTFMLLNATSSNS